MEKNKMASLEILNHKRYIQPTLSFLDAMAACHQQLDISRYHQLRFVVGELLKIRIERAYPSGRGKLYVELYLTETYLEVSIRDKGVPGWHDFSYESEDITKDEKALNNYILDLYTDEVGMEKLGADGQRIFVRKSIKNPLTFQAPEPYKEEVALDTNITIRPVQTEADVIEAIRCIYSEYGYSYSYERLYYVDSFMRLLREGEVLSYLAVNDHGQTAGHFALVCSDLYPNMPEISTVVIKKEFRGLGLFSKFMDFSEKVGREQGFRALMGQPVTFHPMSQKAFLRAGYTATSLLMSYLGANVESEYNQEGERLGLSASVKMLDSSAHSNIYPPKEMAAFIQKVYGRLGLSYTLCEGGVSACTRMSMENNKPLKMTKILLHEAASDVAQHLEAAVKEAIRQKSEMIELVILLNDPSCAHAYQAAKERQFVLSGIIPGGEKGDYLIMQMLPGDTMDYDKLVLVGEFEELKNDILNIMNEEKEEGEA